MKCSKCGFELADGAKFCKSCGAQVEAVNDDKNICTACGYENKADAVFCTKCGNNIAEKEPQQVVTTDSLNVDYQDDYSIPQLKNKAKVRAVMEEEEPQFYEDVVKEKSSSKGKTAVIIILLLIILAMVGFFGYVFMFNDGNIPFINTPTEPVTEATTEATTEPTTEAMADVPSVAGASYQLALQRISDAGLKETHTFEYSDIVSKNCIISQTPEPGTKLKKGETVTLVISNGSQNATTPSTIPKETTTSGTNSEVNSAVTSTAGYILPDSSSRYLTISDIQGMSADELGLARNEIFARHGRKFQNETYKNYFNSKSWYKGTVEPENFSNSVLNKYESANATFLSDQEDYMLAHGKLNSSLTSAG